MLLQRERATLFVGVAFWLGCLGVPLPKGWGADVPASRPELWDLARSKQAVHRFSTLFTAQDVRERLATEDGIKAALRWCKQTGITKVYVESFRDGYQA